MAANEVKDFEKLVLANETEMRCVFREFFIKPFKDCFRKRCQAIKDEFNKKNEKLLLERNKLAESIPNFWVETLQNFPLLQPILSDEDLEVLDYISGIEVESDPSFSEIRFSFDENPYFQNQQLTKRYSISPETGIYTESKATKIKWKGSQVKEKNNLQDDGGFFDWFADESNPIGDVIGKAIIFEIYPYPSKVNILKLFEINSLVTKWFELTYNFCL